MHNHVHCHGTKRALFCLCFLCTNVITDAYKVNRNNDCASATKGEPYSLVWRKGWTVRQLDGAQTGINTVAA